MTGGQPILEYQIKIFIPALKEFIQDPTCVPAITTQRSCSFTMNYLEDTYAFKYGDMLQAIARSRNLHGFSEYSSSNTEGVIALTRPAFMYPVYEGINTVKDAVELLWHPIVKNE